MMSVLVKDLLARNLLVKELLAGMTWKSTVVLSGAGVLATWIAAVPPEPTESVTVRPQLGAGPPASAAAEVEEQASKLALRLRQHEPYEAPNRNPFRFGSSRASEPTETVQPVPPAVTPTTVAPRPVPPLPVLAGVATDIVDGAEQRTAILSGPSGVVLAREGDEVGGHYRVNRVEAEAIELMRLEDGSVVRLGLRP
jgi:hypothetical protein